MNVHCESIFVSAKKGCIDCLVNIYSKNMSEAEYHTASDIAIENGNILYLEKLLENCLRVVEKSQSSSPPIKQTPSVFQTIVSGSSKKQTPSVFQTNVSAIIEKEIVKAVVKCPHGYTEGHQIIGLCTSGCVDYCCGDGNAGGGWCRSCGGRGYIDRLCPHRQWKSHNFVAGFCNGPQLS